MWKENRVARALNACVDCSRFEKGEIGLAVGVGYRLVRNARHDARASAVLFVGLKRKRSKKSARLRRFFHEGS
jgi:hypothetical protein